MAAGSGEAPVGRQPHVGDGSAQRERGEACRQQESRQPGALAAGAGSSPSFGAFQSLGHLWVVGFYFIFVFLLLFLVLGEQQTGEPGCVDAPSRANAGTANPLPHRVPPRCW